MLEGTDILPSLPSRLNGLAPTACQQQGPLDGTIFLNYLTMAIVKGLPSPTPLCPVTDCNQIVLLFNQWTPWHTKARSMIDYKKQMNGLRTEQYKLILNPAMDRANYPSHKITTVVDMQKTDPLETTEYFCQQPALSAQLVAVLAN